MSSSAAQPLPPVTIANSELRRIRSTIVDQEYLVKIRLPQAYAESNHAYPVLYLLDGDHAFAMATDVVQYLIYGEHVPDLIIVSPAYGSKNAPRHGGTNMRERDLLPFPVSWTAASPGADQYLRFLQNELMPAMESDYRIDPSDRTLWGYSLGGLFVVYALLCKPGLFRRYAVVDGFDQALFELEESYAQLHRSLPARLHFSAGPNIDAERFYATLQGRSYAGLELDYAALYDGGHFTVPAEGLTKSLVALFRKPPSRVLTAM